jgi:hypothetical protein
VYYATFPIHALTAQWSAPFYHQYPVQVHTSFFSLPISVEGLPTCHTLPPCALAHEDLSSNNSEALVCFRLKWRSCCDLVPVDCMFPWYHYHEEMACHFAKTMQKLGNSTSHHRYRSSHGLPNWPGWRWRLVSRTDRLSAATIIWEDFLSSGLAQMQRSQASRHLQYHHLFSL